MPAHLAQPSGAGAVAPSARGYELVRSAARPGRTVVRVRAGVTFGGSEIAICAGPCSVESRDQVEQTAATVARSGANVLRGGAFKPRTSPYAFQGLGAEGLRYLRDAADRYDLAVVTEVLDVRDVELVSRATRTCCRSARATCRTSRCCARWVPRRARSCSSAASPLRSTSG